MGWLERIRSLLGLQSNGHRETGDVEVTVEKDPEADTERAVKEPASAEAVDRDEPTEGGDEPLEGEDADREETAEETEAEVEGESEAEPDEAAGVDTDEAAEAEPDEAADVDADDAAEAEPDEAAEVDADDAAEAEPDEELPGGEPASEPADPIELTEIKGIGSAYADRLRAAGVDDGADLAAADAADLSATTDISEKRLQRWIDRASER
ncbi:MAG: helix-hairpin-helix domain-containing protein [Halanaeroarchaeum sp.]